MNKDHAGDVMFPGIQETGFSKRSKFKTLRKFLWERKLAIIFRALGFIAIAFDIYSVVKKLWRQHYAWAVSSAVLLFLTRIIGAIYSLYCEVVEKLDLDLVSPDEEEYEISKEIKPLHHTEEYGFAADQCEVIVLTDDESEDNASGKGEVINEAEHSDELEQEDEMAVKFKSLPRSMKFNKLDSQISYHGTFIEPNFENQKDLTLEQFFDGVIHHCSLWMKLTHILPIPFPQEYQFFRASHVLWRHYSEKFHEEACKMIKEAGIQEECFRPLILKYCQRKIISKQISLVMATVQTIPMILIELLYWTVLSSSIFDKKSPETISFWSSYGGDQFNVFELASLVINVVNISYRLISLTSEIRKVNFLKQNMRTIHKIYFTILYSVLLFSRILSIYLVMCLNGSGRLFAMFLLVNQFITVLVITFNLKARDGGQNNHEQRENKISVLLSNLFMLFLYLPPKSGKRISQFGYYLITIFEMLAMFAFGWYQLESDPELEVSIMIVGHKISAEHFHIIYGGMFLIFIACWILSSKTVSKLIIQSKNEMTWLYIKNILDDANSQYGTKYIIEGQGKNFIYISRHSINVQI